MNITLRPAVENDFPAIVEMFREFAHFEHLDERLTNTVERMKAETEYFNCFVAVKEDDEIVGYATYFFSYFTWTGKSRLKKTSSLRKNTGSGCIRWRVM